MTYKQRRKAFKTDVMKYVIDLKARHQLSAWTTVQVLKEITKELGGNLRSA